jgi:hypothetical protein
VVVHGTLSSTEVVPEGDREPTKGSPIIPVYHSPIIPVRTLLSTHYSLLSTGAQRPIPCLPAFGLNFLLSPDATWGGPWPTSMARAERKCLLPLWRQ